MGKVARKGPRVFLIFSGLGLLLALTAITPSASAEGGDPAAAAPTAAATGHDHEGHHHELPDRSALGLDRDSHGACAGMYRVRGTNECSHGPDAPPPGYDVNGDFATPDASAVEPAADPAACDGDGVTGNRVEVLYTRTPDRTDRYTSMVTQIRAWAIDAELIYRESAAETGGMRRLRFVHDASCTVIVRKVNFDSNADDDTFGASITELQRQGYNRTDRKYMVFADATGAGICGIGNIWNDDQPGSANLNNGGPSYGRTDASCWGSEVPAHELNHNIGGVQLSAPRTSNGWHCVDEYDRMCYSDSPDFPTMQFICLNPSHDRLLDCNHDDYYSTNPPSGSYLATKWNSANSTYLVKGTQAKWGYVWANNATSASYTPSTLYQFNSAGSTNTITRSAVGVYQVRFPLLGGANGTVHVTAHGTTSHACKVASWGPSGTAQLVNVRCYTTAGAPVNASFTASFNHNVAYPSQLAYVLANNATAASYTPTAAYRFNSNGGTNTISRTGVGAYTVNLPLLGSASGNVQVTAYGTTTGTCKVASWSTSGSAKQVRVQCHTAGGQAVDSVYTMTFGHLLGVTGVPGQRAAYVFADNATSASYTPSAAYNFNWRSGQTNTITRSAVGVYQVSLPTLGAASGHVTVTAYGASSNECKVASWGPSGTTQLVNVRCFTSSGAAADSRFSMSYVRNTRG